MKKLTMAVLVGLLLTLVPNVVRAQAQDQEVGSKTEPELPVLDLDLFEAMEMALRYNLQVQIASFTPDTQREGITSARGRFDPSFRFDLPQRFSRNVSQGTSQLTGADVLTSENIAAGFTFSHLLEYGTSWSIAWNTSRQVTNNAFSTFNPLVNASLALTVQQPLLRNFGKQVNTQQIIVARNNHRQSEEQFRQQVQNILFQAYQAYWELVFSERDLAVKQLSLDLAVQQLERNRIQVEIGTLAPIETIQAEQQVANRELALLQAQIAVRDREDDLKRVLNIDAASQHGWNVDIHPTTEPEVNVDTVDVREAVRIAIDNDPLLRQRRIALETSVLNLRVARNQMLPDLNFNGSINLSGQGGDRLITTGGFGSQGVLEIQPGGFGDALRNLMSADFRNWSVGLSITFPLNNWAAKAQHAQAVINERSVRVQIADREQELRVEVLKAARQVETGAQQVEQSRVALELADRQLEAEQRKFAVGTTTNFQVLDFQRQLADAQSVELRSIINYVNALAQLEQAKGTLLGALRVSIGMAGVPSANARR